MNTNLILKNALIVTPDEVFSGSIQVRNGLIHDITMGSTSSPDTIDLEGEFLIPGLIDVHTDNLERHMLPRNNADWPVMAALLAHDAQLATSGITTVLDSMCVGTAGKGVRNFANVRAAIASIDETQSLELFRVDHLLHLRAELSNEQFPEMFEQVCDHPRLRLVSLMDHTPGQRQWADLEKYIAMEKRDFKLSQEEIDAFVQKCRHNHEVYSQPNRRAVLSMMRNRPIALASHDDTTIEHVQQSHAEGITISEFPTTITAARAARDHGMKIVAGAPNLVLGRSHSGNVAVDELATAGLVDALSSDYAPSSLLNGAFQMNHRIGINLCEAINTITLNPARLVGLDDRGSLEIGLRADLVRVRLVNGLPVVRSVWRSGSQVA